MSGKATGWVLDNADAKGSELLLLICIADVADHDGSGAWPSIDSLARRMRMSPRAVRYLIARMEERGELTVSYKAGPKGTNLYALTRMQSSQSEVQRLPGRRAHPAADVAKASSADVATQVAPERPERPEKNTTEETTSPPARGPELVEVVRRDASVVVKAYVDAHREAYDGADPTDVGRMATLAKQALKGRWPFDDVLAAAQACARDPFGAAALDKRLRAARGARASDGGPSAATRAGADFLARRRAGGGR